MTPTILIVSHVVPFPPAAGNEIRILKMIQWLRRQGYRVVYLLNAKTLKPEKWQALRMVVDELHLVGDNFDNQLMPTWRSKPRADGVRKNLSVRARDSVFRLLMTKDGRRKKAASDEMKRGLAPPRLV